MKKKIYILFITTILLVTSCTPKPNPKPTPQLITEQPETTTTHIVISEVLAGIPGNNLYDFIELYNPTREIINLKGYSLWYILNDDDEETLIKVWDTSALIPPQGHYLLGQQDQDFGIISDTTFNQPLVPNRGGLILKNLEREITDSLAWGQEASRIAIEGSAAPAMHNGTALERTPGNVHGNGTDTDNNSKDFQLNYSPNPQNSGSPITPLEDKKLNFTIFSPGSIPPGEIFEITLQLENNTGTTLQGITALLNLPNPLTIQSVEDGVEFESNQVTWNIEELDKSKIATSTITVTAPWTYTTFLTHSYYATASNWHLPSFGSPFLTNIEGGSIPINTARELLDTEVVIEGTASMYVGGFYAGSGAKFYISDDTGGAQVYVAGAGNTLRVNIGDRVRVQGMVTLYRDSIEIVPASEGNVEILETNHQEVTPITVSIREAANNTTSLPGALVKVEGTLARVEEFSYSYEIDIVDQDGQLLTLYVDKETNISIDEIQSGYQFRVTGIIENLDGNLRLYPRVQSDFQRIYPETLLIDAQTEVSVETGEEFSIHFNVFNHTKETIQNVEAVLPIPEGFSVTNISENGTQNNNEIVWIIDEIEGNGNFKTVSLAGQITPGADYITIGNYQVSPSGSSEIVTGQTTYTFSGGTVPIWAIQGSDLHSPYTNRYLETQGIVTAVFPELEGFWLQESVTDSDPQTSDGIFVHTKGFLPDLDPGDQITVSAIVQEYYQQTQLTVGSANNISTLRSGVILPTPTPLNPPADADEAITYYEALEGMLVTVQEEATAIAPTNRYGEFAFVLSSHNRDRLFQGEDNGIIMMADDGSIRTHDNQSTLEYIVTVGDKLTNITGPLAFSFGNYKIEPIAQPDLLFGENTYNPLPPLGNDQFSIMTWNVENLFDIRDPHPSSPPLPKVSEYKQSITKVAETIIAAGIPTIVGLQEVENIEILEDIAQNDILLEFNYIPVLIEGTDSRGIDVGYLVRSDQAKILLKEQYPAPEGITSRPPLLVKVQLITSDKIIYVLNNHFTSMSGGEAATEPRRNAQAAWNATVMEEILAQEPDAFLAVIGDLNSYYHSVPIDTLRNSGLLHVFQRIPAEERYTYIYEGVSQTLDHILVTPSLDTLISKVSVLHSNSGFPISAPDDFSPIHKSDHDPVIVIFSAP